MFALLVCLPYVSLLPSLCVLSGHFVLLRFVGPDGLESEASHCRMSMFVRSAIMRLHSIVLMVVELPEES